MTFCPPPHPWAALKKPILNRVKLSVRDISRSLWKICDGVFCYLFVFSCLLFLQKKAASWLLAKLLNRPHSFYYCTCSNSGVPLVSFLCLFSILKHSYTQLWHYCLRYLRLSFVSAFYIFSFHLIETRKWSNNTQSRIYILVKHLRWSILQK